MSYAHYLRRKPRHPMLTDERGAYNVYMYLYAMNYEWSRRQNCTMIHMDGVAMDEYNTPVHVQLHGFQPHFMINFENCRDRYPDNASEVAFLKKLDGKLREHLAQNATTNKPLGRLVKQIFNLPNNLNPKTATRQGQDKLYSYFTPSPGYGQQQKQSHHSADAYDDDNLAENDLNELEQVIADDVVDPSFVGTTANRETLAFEPQQAINNPQYVQDYVRHTQRPLVSGWRKTKRLPLQGYTPEPYMMWDISVIHPKLVKELRELIEAMDPRIELYDVTTDFITRFLVDKQTVPCSWFRLTRQQYQRLYDEQKDGKYNRTHIPEFIAHYSAMQQVENLPRDLLFDTLDQIELDTFFNNKEHIPIQSLASPDAQANGILSGRIWDEFIKWKTSLASQLPNFSQLALDIECDHPATSFPDARTDPCVSIQAQLYGRQSQSQKGDVKSMAWIVGDTDPVETADRIFACRTEEDMLAHFHRFLVDVDPDVVCHHNGNEFDWKYLFDRAKVLKLDNFQMLGRSRYARAYQRETQNKGFNKASVAIQGRMNLDVRRYSQDTYSSAKNHDLDTLARVHINASKADFSHDRMREALKTKQGRRKLLLYGLVDVDITRRIITKMRALENTLMMCSSTGIAFQTCLDRGQGAKMEALMYQTMNKMHNVHWFDVAEDGQETRHEASCKFALRYQKKVYQTDEEFAQQKQAEKEAAKQLKKKEAKVSNANFAKVMYKESLDPTQSRLNFLPPRPVDASAATEDHEAAGQQPVPPLLLKPGTKEFDEFLSLSAEDRAVERDPEEERSGENADLYGVADNIAGKKGTYAGAVVLTTKGGFYGHANYYKMMEGWRSGGAELMTEWVDTSSSPVVTLDFASMYPSIIIEKNLCHCTKISDEEIKRRNFKEGVHYWRRPKMINDEKNKRIIEEPDPTGPAFVLKRVRDGLLPQIEETLGAKRKYVRKVLKQKVDDAATKLIEMITKYFDENAFKGVKTVNSAAIKKASAAMFKRQETLAKERHGHVPQLKEQLAKDLRTLELLEEAKKLLQADYAPRAALEKLLNAMLEQCEQLEEGSNNWELLQTIIKLIMNSLYGLTGDKTSKFFEPAIAGTITYRGRCMIYTIKYEAETTYTKKNGYPFDANVVFGDTDSIGVELKGLGMKWVRSDSVPADDPYRKKEFVTMHKELPGSPMLYLKDAFMFGVEMAKSITKKHFKAPCVLEFEKVMTEFNNQKQKNYTAVKWMLDPNEPSGAVMVKGCGFKKRFLPSFTQGTGKEATDIIGLECDPLKAVETARARMRKLFAGQVPVPALKFTQKLSKDPADYGTKPPAVQLALNRMAKDKTDVVKAGEFISYILCDFGRMNHDRKKNYKRSEQVMAPLEVMSKEMPIDLSIYKELTDNQLYRIFHYPLRLFLCNPALATYEPNYPNIEFSKDNDPLIQVAFQRYFYRGVDLSALTKTAVTYQEVQSDKGSIAFHFKPAICPACDSMFKQTVPGQRVCLQCKDHETDKLGDRRKELLVSIREVSKPAAKCWQTCSDCVNGDLVEAQKCVSTSCINRGERHLADRNLDKLNARLIDLEDIVAQGPVTIPKPAPPPPPSVPKPIINNLATTTSRKSSSSSKKRKTTSFFTSSNNKKQKTMTEMLPPARRLVASAPVINFSAMADDDADDNNEKMDELHQEMAIPELEPYDDDDYDVPNLSLAMLAVPTRSRGPPVRIKYE